MPTVIAIDAGTTGVRALAVDEFAQVTAITYRELTQHYPKPGWVEHDAEEIWRLVVTTVNELIQELKQRDERLVGIAITNQRETVVSWDRATGRALHPAIVWQDKRTSERCDELAAAGSLDHIRSITGLVLDPYFSATKMEWLLRQGVGQGAHELALGTVDSWILWKLTGEFATDLSNASRTMLCDIGTGSWSPTLCALFDIPLESLPSIQPSLGRFGIVRHPDLASASGLNVSGIAGDQQAALFGQACFSPGMVKATYGTGAFVLSNAGEERPPNVDGLLTTIAWGIDSKITYAYEGSAFVAGAAVQWLRDELQIIERSEDLEPLARTATESDGLSFIPAFAGLGSPWWDDSARGAIIGITRGSTRASLANAIVNALAFEVRAMTDVIRDDTPSSLREIRVDGGAAAMNLLLERLSNQARVPVARPLSLETTALGAATMAGLYEGMFPSLESLANLWSAQTSFSPVQDQEVSDAAYQSWLAALAKTRNW